MRQRAALLRTLLFDTDVILLDEPFGALDAQTKLQMQEWLLRCGPISARRWCSSPTMSRRRSICPTKFMSWRRGPAGSSKPSPLPIAAAARAQRDVSPEFIAIKERCLELLRPTHQSSFDEAA